MTWIVRTLTEKHTVTFASNPRSIIRTSSTDTSESSSLRVLSPRKADDVEINSMALSRNRTWTCECVARLGCKYHIEPRTSSFSVYVSGIFLGGRKN
jgi:hypothetical protein